MTLFRLSGEQLGSNHLGLYGNKTCLETPGPASYDAFPLHNPPALSMHRPNRFPDRTPGYINVVDRGHTKWRPEPFSLSRLQSEQPLVHYASATFFSWPEQRRRNAFAISGAGGGEMIAPDRSTRRPSRGGSSELGDEDLSEDVTQRLGRRQRSASNVGLGGSGSMSGTGMGADRPSSTGLARVGSAPALGGVVR